MRNIAQPRLGDDCPFLELPPEVRNRIYEYAIGGHNLHVFVWNRLTRERSPKWPVKNYVKQVLNRNIYTGQETSSREYFWVQYVLCQCPASDDGAYKLTHETPDESKYGRLFMPNTKDHANPTPLEFKSYAQRHRACLDVDVLKYDTVGYRKRVTTPKLAMALLRTCKQIYNEAALVPYYNNTFSFARGADLEVFVTCVLSERQRAALQNVSYAMMDAGTCGNGRRAIGQLMKCHVAGYRILQDIRPKTFDRLSGLKELTIMIDAKREWIGGHARLWDQLPRMVCPELKARVMIRTGDFLLCG
ncbi:hypothetical protein Slin15195_G025830 [Septoria linicola]|uniref:Uncharacterized protein n=1 Tax=Septoria linicola TaxID=215465 RepID=A0A9Q9AH16_9PEZI|nr:hypothetical protein Slin15195_G025830 [Septoria linicola]